MATTNTFMRVEFVMQLANHGSPRGGSTVVCTRESRVGSGDRSSMYSFFCGMYNSHCWRLQQ